MASSSIQSLQKTISHMRHLLRPRPCEEYSKITYNQFLALHSAVDYVDKNKKELIHRQLEEDHAWIINDFPQEMQLYLQKFTVMHHPCSPHKDSSHSIKNFELVRHNYFPALHAQPQVISHYLYTKKMYQKVDERCSTMLKNKHK